MAERTVNDSEDYRILLRDSSCVTQVFIKTSVCVRGTQEEVFIVQHTSNQQPDNMAHVYTDKQNLEMTQNLISSMYA